MFGQIVLAIISLGKAVPIFDKWMTWFSAQVQKIQSAIRIYEFAKAKQENREAVVELLKNGDVRGVEKLIGNPYAGKPDPSVPGTDIGPMPGM